MIARAALILLLGTTSVFGADCPPERPHARQMMDYTKPITCTLIACTGELRCPKDGGICSVVPSDCNKCTEPSIITVCLSDNELAKATK